MKTKLKFCTSRGNEAYFKKSEIRNPKSEMSQSLLTSSATVQRVASGLCPDIFPRMSQFSGHRPDATTIANGQPSSFGGQKEPKTEPDIIMSGFEIIKSVSDMIMSMPDITESEADIIMSKTNITESEADIIMLEANITKSETNIIKSEANITKSEANITKSEANITKSVPDIIMLEVNITKSEPDFIIKMVKKLHLVRKCQKTGQFDRRRRVKRIFNSSRGNKAQFQTENRKSEIGSTAAPAVASDALVAGSEFGSRASRTASGGGRAPRIEDAGFSPTRQKFKRYCPRMELFPGSSMR